MVELLQGLRDCLCAEAEMHGPLVPVEPLKGFARRITNLIPVENPVRTLSSLEDLRHYVENATLVPIDATRTKAVFGEGNARARIMLVGDLIVVPGVTNFLSASRWIWTATSISLPVFSPHSL